MMHSVSAIASSLEQLIEEFASRIEVGESPAVEEFVAAHPELAEQLRRVLPTMLVLAELGRSAAAGQAGESAVADSGPAGTLGDFRILREVGRGGMGIVYEAEQLSLRRRVALKVLPLAATMDPRQLQRFHNEARAAASLEHPHIVPVYGVGCERAVHFYAMKFIDGRTLAESIAERRGSTAGTGSAEPSSGPTPSSPVSPSTETVLATKVATEPVLPSGAFFRRVAEWGVQAAEALEHAHALGVVHRDVKPANLMVDGQGNLWVTDFGLARVGADAGLTMTGDVLGTLRYMSPEQALAKHGLVDHRSDVYSLGVTLYELLTGMPAVDGKDREEILNRITLEESQPPRSFDTTIPRDLETVVLKAMAKTPAERYSSAAALAEDLRRFLADRPVQARRPTVLKRVAQWGRRHHGVVWSGGLGLLLAVVVLAVSSILLWREKEQVKRTLAERDQQHQRAEQQRRRAENNFGKVLDGMTEFLHELDTNEALDRQQRGKLRQALANHMEWFFQRMQNEASTDPVTRMETGWAYLHLGTFYSRLGDYAQAVEKCRKALGILEPLANEHPEDLGILWVYLTCLNRLGSVLFLKGETSEARAFFRRAVQQYRHWLDVDPSGRAHLEFADFLVTCVDLEQHDSVEAVRLAARVVEITPDSSEGWYILGQAHFRSGNWLAARHDFEECMLLEGHGYAGDYFFLAMIHWKLGEQERAQDYFDRGVQWMSSQRGQHSFFLRQLRAEAAKLLGKKAKESEKLGGGMP